MSESLRVMYHNVLSDPGHEAEQLAYFHALQDAYEPDVLFLTELRSGLVSELAPEKYHVDYAHAIKDRRHGWEGIGIVTRFHEDEVKITREQSWNGEPIRNYLRYDARELVRIEVPTAFGRIALYAGHIFHPHHLHYPVFGVTRPHQWRHLRNRLANEPLPFAWFADTNTLSARAVNRGLQPLRTKAQLLPHDGEGPQRTWRPVGPVTDFLRHHLAIDVPDVLYLDRAAVRSDLATRTQLETIPTFVDGVKNPSDHRPIMLTIASDINEQG